MEPIYLTIIVFIICALVGYIFGSIPVAVTIGKVFFKKDIREYGSKNAGGTNAGRVLGKKVGLIVILLDILKTVVPVLSSYFILKYTGLNYLKIEEYGYLITSLACIIGHCYPIFAQFKGGKAVSCFAAICLATSWLLSIIGLLIFFIVLKIKKYVSLGSIVASSSVFILSICLLFLPNNFGMNFTSPSWYYSLLLLVCTGILIFRHRQNIVRLINHQESKIKWLK